MPRYLNNTENSITPAMYKTILPGATGNPYKYLPFPGLLTKLSDLPSPIDCYEITADSIGTPLEELAQYKTLIFHNLSNAAVTFKLNNQTAMTAVPLVKDGMFPISNDRDIDAVQFYGTITSGAVYVIGVKTTS